MAEIEITDEQRAYLDDLRESLRADHVDRYGHVRPADALQYLIDVNEGDVASDDGDVDAADGAADDSDGRDEATDAADGEDDEARLDAMMSLLDTHDEHWSESDADDARYEVELPDGSVERVRTRDDVRSLLFQHYR
jgi:hypothetical protein